jgi:hypothetical protein
VTHFLVSFSHRLWLCAGDTADNGKAAVWPSLKVETSRVTEGEEGGWTTNDDWSVKSELETPDDLSAYEAAILQLEQPFWTSLSAPLVQGQA